MVTKIPFPKNLADAKVMYAKAREAYYNDNPIMSDAEFDNLEDWIAAAAPKWSGLKKTGVATKHKKEVEHEYFMPSLSKAYPEHQPKYLAKYPSPKYVAMAKLDGTSLALTYRKGKPVRLVTRGDGIIGGDVSHFIPFLCKHGIIPYAFNTKKDVTLRLEGMMRTRTFEKNWSREAKGDKGFDNARNMVNGLFNRQQAHPAMKDVELLVLGVFGMPLEEGLAKATDWGFDVVPYVVANKSFIADLSMEWARREWTFFDMDGVVIAPKAFHYEYENADKPKGIWAYKENDHADAAEVEVVDIVWQKSRTGRWTPKIKIAPTRMGGVTVTNATAHNANWILERKIGPGAVLKVLRSGGVIPKIVDVVKGVSEKKMKYPSGEYRWDGKYIVDTQETATERVRKLHFFMETMGVEGAAEKSLTKMHDLSLLTEVLDLLILAKHKVPPRTMVEALGQANSKKVLAQLQAALEAPKLRKLMVASQCFGIGVGDRVLAKIEANGLPLGLAMKMDMQQLHGTLTTMPGFKDKTAAKIADGMIVFAAWYKRAREYVKADTSIDLPKVKKQVTGPLTGINVSWTGYRDKEQEAKVESLGGTIVTFSVSKTTVLLYKEGGKASTKIEKAKVAMTWEQFVKVYKVK